MNESVSLVVRTADRTRSAGVILERRMTIADVLDACRHNWKLPNDVSYGLVNATSGKGLLPASPLLKEVVADGDELVVNPMLVAGGR